jgi:hypothetical protein
MAYVNELASHDLCVYRTAISIQDTQLGVVVT